jgi:hypothetical protein
VRLFSTARNRRLFFVVVMMVVLAFPLVSTLVTRARVERSGVDVTATVVEATRSGEAYLVAFRLPEDVDPEQRTYSATVDRASYEKAVESETITVRVLDGRPEAHRVEGEIDSNAPYVVTAVALAIVLIVGLWWVRVGRRRPPVRMRALGPLEPAADEDAGSLERVPDEDIYEAVGTLLSADAAEAVLDLGERRVVVALDGHAHGVEVGSPARVRGSVIG